MVNPPKLKFAKPKEKSVALWLANPQSFATALAAPEKAADLPGEALRFAAATRFEAKTGRLMWFVAADGEPAAVFFIESGAKADPFQPGELATLLPPGVYRFATAPSRPDLASLAFLLGAHRFVRYKSRSEAKRLIAPEGVDAAEIESIASSVAFARDLIDTPANDLGPDELEDAVQALARTFGAKVSTVRGEKLAREFPLIHAVGKGSPRAPRLVDLRWKPKRTRRLTLVGKGVCFDSGGLDLKPESAMALMKKDMGGAAAAIAAAAMIMAADLDVALRLIVPIVENSVSGEAFRPGDVYGSRKGLTVEIANTDAEGRLILADALALADEEKPELLIDFATLTGAARVALGPDLPPFFTDDDGLAADIARHGAKVNDPVWRLPLWSGYESKLDGKVAQLNNAPAGGMAGAITAALFLRRFVAQSPSWAHFDIYGWTPVAKAGRPEGGEAQAARLIFSLAHERFGKAKLR
ncbi:leucyl aminopeptidase family protein [Rhodoblastus sp.]|uniref:leucyl aminopeptidase family protein n=1 Tax=Rhodoblastus sp. TaxID=1962975 RepID=UPI00263196E0|nr:leucyl aminopeptidase family protein [Rhodoblastus sp.]